jgi:hypothetical protein
MAQCKGELSNEYIDLRGVDIDLRGADFLVSFRKSVVDSANFRIFQKSIHVWPMRKRGGTGVTCDGSKSGGR